MRVYLIDFSTTPARIRKGDYTRSADKKVANVVIDHETVKWHKDLMYTSFKGAKDFLSRYYRAKDEEERALYFMDLVEVLYFDKEPP